METLTITFDPAMRPDGRHALCSDYVETFWLPRLGPSSIVLLRTLGRMYEPIATSGVTPHTYIPVAQLAHSLGLKGGISPNSRLGRTFARLEWYRIANITGPLALTVAPYLPTLTARHVANLPQCLQAIHHESAETAVHS